MNNCVVLPRTTNVLKHAKATNVTVKLTRDSESAILEIKDNGKGITDADLSKPKSFGIMGMRERVYPWGGNVDITSGKNGGTIVRVSIPITKEKAD